MIKIIDQRIRRHLAGIRLVFRGVVTLIKAAGAVQLVQLDGLAGEQLQDAEYFQHYGYTSNPPAGTMCVVLPVGGKTAHGIIIATEHGTYRLRNLAPGETALYSDEGDSVLLKRGRIVQVTAGNALIVNTHDATVNCTGKATVKANGGVEIDGAGAGTVKGIVQGNCICAFTGMPHPHISATVTGSA
jgi:phage baseplate assembly protein V